VGGEGLADGADVVALALDGEQHGAADGARLTGTPFQVSLPSGIACSWNTSRTVSRKNSALRSSTAKYSS
jgi:hypothetical protein